MLPCIAIDCEVYAVKLVISTPGWQKLVKFLFFLQKDQCNKALGTSTRRCCVDHSIRAWAHDHDAAFSRVRLPHCMHLPAYTRHAGEDITYLDLSNTRLAACYNLMDVLAHLMQKSKCTVAWAIAYCKAARRHTHTHTHTHTQAQAHTHTTGLHLSEQIAMFQPTAHPLFCIFSQSAAQQHEAM